MKPIPLFSLSLLILSSSLMAAQPEPITLDVWPGDVPGEKGVPAELHIYDSGGHGFGLRPSDKPCSTWPQRCEQWLRSRGLLKK
jgi:hypothetical protein